MFFTKFQIIFNIFSCQDGWEGTNCITAVCSEPCGNGNHCIAPEICRCAPLNTVKMIKDTNGNIAKVSLTPTLSGESREFFLVWIISELKFYSQQQGSAPVRAKKALYNVLVKRSSKFSENSFLKKDIFEFWSKALIVSIF